MGPGSDAQEPEKRLLSIDKVNPYYHVFQASPRLFTHVLHISSIRASSGLLELDTQVVRSVRIGGFLQTTSWNLSSGALALRPRG